MRVLTPVQIEALGAAERERYLTELAAFFSARVRETPDFASAARAIVAECRESGHELQSFDEDDTWQVWCGEATRLVLSLVHSAGVEATWRY